MNRRDLLATSAAALAAGALPVSARTPGAPMPQTRPVPPVAKKIPVTIEQLGRTRTDDYQWMKDDNWQAVLRDPTRDQARGQGTSGLAENAYREAMMVSTLPLQGDDVRGDEGADQGGGQLGPLPRRRLGNTMSPSTGPGISIRDTCVKPRTGGGTALLLLDANALAEGKAYSEVSAAEHSPDHALFAYAEDAQGIRSAPDFRPGSRDRRGPARPDRLGLPAASPSRPTASGSSGPTVTTTDGRTGFSVARRVAARRPWSIRKRTTALFMSVGRTADDAFHPDLDRQPGNVRDPGRPGCDPDRPRFRSFWSRA